MIRKLAATAAALGAALLGAGFSMMGASAANPNIQATGVWSAQPTAGGDSSPYLLGVSCPKNQNTHCWAVGEGSNNDGTANGNGQIFHDWSGGGSSFSAGSDVTGVPPLRAVSCPELNNCWAVGASGTILHNGLASSTTTWFSQASGTTATLLGVSCPTNKECVVTGSGGVILDTFDGGATWTPAVSGTTKVLYGVNCSAPQHCVTVGQDGTILRTTNTGDATWVPEVSNTPYTLDATYCVSQYCYAVGDLQGAGPGAAIRWSPGSGTWRTPASNLSHKTLFGISCTGTSRCAAAGDDGQIIDTTTGGSAWTDNSPGTVVQLDAVSCMVTPTKVCVVVGVTGLVYKGTP